MRGDWAYRLIAGRPMTDSEWLAIRQYQRAQVASRDSADTWADLVQVLLIDNEALFLD
jgi:hypothetical protein